MIPPIPLELLAVGEVGVVDAVVGDSPAVHRLHELGFRTGAELEMLQRGSCCMVRLGEKKLGLRQDDSVSILVRLSGAGVGR